jgi:hypothetical protein
MLVARRPSPLPLDRSPATPLLVAERTSDLPLAVIIDGRQSFSLWRFFRNADRALDDESGNLSDLRKRLPLA